MGSDGPSTLYYPVGAAFLPGRKPSGPEASRISNDFYDFYDFYDLNGLNDLTNSLIS